jgi:ABC-type branched-subunit amino acid transport system substrate-binding protein
VRAFIPDVDLGRCEVSAHGRDFDVAEPDGGSVLVPGPSQLGGGVARNLGFTGSLIGGNTMNSTATASMLGTAGLGAVSGAAWTRHVSFPANASFLQAYQGAYGQPADEFAAQAFTAVEILAAALHTAKPGWGAGATVAAQRTAVQSALADTALMTPLGPFRFTADHDVDQTVWIVAVGGGGTHTLVGFCNPGC